MKPLRMFTGGLTGRIYATRRYTERDEGLYVAHSKEDVTDEALAAVAAHLSYCKNPEHVCHRILELRRLLA